MVFAQVVLGPPGSGKTTYVLAVREFMRTQLGRKVCAVNIDPACEGLWPPSPSDEQDEDSAKGGKSASSCPDEKGNSAKKQGGKRKDDAADGNSGGGQPVFDIDVRELVRSDEVMERLELGPNAALVFCMEFLARNLEWLKQRLDAFPGHTFIFDCPGQVELYTHHHMMREIVQTMQDKWHMRACCVHLVDSYMCSDPASFMSALLVSMSAMMMLELPHINVLSKIDLVEAYGPLHFNLDFYTEVLDLHYLVDQMDASFVNGPRRKRFHALTAALADMVQDYALVHFQTLDVQSQQLMAKLVQAIDKAVGNLYTQPGEGRVAMESAVFSQPPLHESHAYEVQRRYMDAP